MRNNLLKKIEDDYNSMSKTHRVIADLFLNDKVERNTTLLEIAKMSYCSHSTVMRFVKNMGYSNFKVFMDDYFNSSAKTKSSIVSSYALVDKFIQSEHTYISSFIQEIISANKVYVFANGMSHLPAYNLYYKGNMVVNKFQLLSELSEDIIITDDDLVIFVSNSGNSRKLKVLSNTLTKYYLISNYDNTKLANNAIHVFSLNNHVESHFEMDTRPRESIYSLVYFTDCLFSLFDDQYK